MPTMKTASRGVTTLTIVEVSLSNMIHVTLRIQIVGRTSQNPAALFFT